METIRSILRKELKLPIVEIADPNATLDGGDVLFTGQEFFVGISGRTNEAGARAVAAAFPEYPCTPIKISRKVLHLKSCMTMAGPSIICVSNCPEAQDILKKIEREATFKYFTMTVPDAEAANVIYANGSLIHRSEFPSSVAIYEERLDYPRIPIKLWELAKPQASLSCLSILIRKSRSFRL